MCHSDRISDCTTFYMLNLLILFPSLFTNAHIHNDPSMSRTKVYWNVRLAWQGSNQSMTLDGTNWRLGSDFGLKSQETLTITLDSAKKPFVDIPGLQTTKCVTRTQRGKRGKRLGCSLGRSRATQGSRCWKYAREAIIKWLLLYFLVHDNCLCSCYNCINWKP